MPRKRARAWEEPPPKKGGNPLRAAWGAFVTVLVLVLIAYVTGFFIGRTEGFRAIVTGRLEKLLGAPVKIDRVSVDMVYNLTLTGLEAEGGRRAGMPSLKVAKVRIAWRWGDLVRRGSVGVARIELEKPAVVFERVEDGRWAPEPLAPLADFVARQMRFNLPSASPAEATPSSAESETGKKGVRGLEFDITGLETAIAIRRGEISWWVDTAAPYASVEGISLDATPLAVPGRRLTHYLLAVKRASSRDGPAFRDLTVELLDVGDQQILLRFIADHQP